MTDLENQVKTFASAYVAGNKMAQQYDPAKPGFICARAIAEALNYMRDTMEYDAAIGGAAAYYINGHKL